MDLYIEIENNQPKNNPATENNLIEVFGTIPSNWEYFVRVPQPIPGVYQILVSTTSVYGKVNGVWTDIWDVRDMTPAEKTAKQDKVKAEFYAQPDAWNYLAWVFDEEKCYFVPPIPEPTDGQYYFWQGRTTSWVLVPPYPTDGKEYKLDYNTGQWVEV